MNYNALDNSNSPSAEAKSRIVELSSFMSIVTALVIMLIALMLLLYVVIIFWLVSDSSEYNLIEGLEVGGNFKISYQYSYTLGTEYLFKVVPSATFNTVDSDTVKRLNLLFITYISLILTFFIYCLSKLYSLFRNFRNKEIFTRKNTQLLERLGIALIAGMILGKVLDFGAVVLASNYVPTVDAIDIVGSMDSIFILGPVANILVIALVFFCTWILEIGRELYNENEMTI